MKKSSRRQITDIYNLKRFIEVQDRDYGLVLKELSAGDKRSHWMWYNFPQIQGLGGSTMSQKFAISSLAEAKAYWAHPILGPRLRECTQLVISVEGRTVEQIFSHPDNLKFHSCLTLFEQSATDSSIFRAGLTKYFGGTPDQ
jgi:uncharacterized protein (DUF1810 family)